MAWYYGTYACGHEGRENIIGPTKNRQWIADRKFEGLCYECYQAKLEEEREVANKAAEEKAKEMGLPELTGTEKQVAWANTIRQEIIEYLEKYANEDMFSDREGYQKALYYMIQTKTKASWYIDHRHVSIESLKRQLLEEMPTEEELKEREIEKGIRMESAVYPENCEYQVPAEITVRDDEVTVIFQKDDTFREIVKGLGYKWEGIWKRKINHLTGTAADRAAELGNRLLNAGFPISILDEDIRRKAIEADYEPEHDRWIMLQTGGDYIGWLAIIWNERDDRLYQAARKLPRSHWHKGSVVVKSEYYQEVEEFAQLFGFKFSKAALQKIEEAKAIRQSAKVVAPAEPKKVEHKDGLKGILESSNDILDDLRDE